MEDPLVDANGFPRGDIDVYRVREARSSIRSTILFIYFIKNFFLIFAFLK